MIKKTIILSLAIAMAMAACSTNHIITEFGLDLLDNEEQATDAQFCKSLNNTDACCSVETIDSFQIKVNELTDALSTTVGNRDKFYIEARKSVYVLKGTIEKLVNSAEKAIAEFGEPDEGDLNLDDNSILLLLALGFAQIGTELVGAIPDLQAGFLDYQSARTTCVKSLMNYQAAVWCLACTPDSGDLGLSTSSLSLHNDFKTLLHNNCIHFILYSAEQNQIIGLYYISSMFDALATAFDRMVSGDEEAFSKFMTEILEIEIPDDSTLLPSETPENCDENDCEWITDELFKDGIVDLTLLSAGGELNENPINLDISRRLTQKQTSKAPPRRKLQGGWNPDDDESGVEVNFVDNPGNVDNSDLFAFRNGIIASLFAVLITLLL